MDRSAVGKKKYNLHFNVRQFITEVKKINCSLPFILTFFFIPYKVSFIGFSSTKYVKMSVAKINRGGILNDEITNDTLH